MNDEIKAPAVPVAWSAGLGVVRGMRVWLENRRATSIKARTPEQKGWDSGIMAAAEYLRRRTGSEQVAVELHQLLLSTRLPGDSASPNGNKLSRGRCRREP